MAKKKEKNKFSGFNNNITLFIITLILSFAQVMMYRPKYSTYCVCNAVRNYDCGFTGIQFTYTPGIIHILIAILFAIIFLGTIVYSIYIIFFDKAKKKKYEIVLNIIFAIVNVAYILFVPYNTFKNDIKYGTEVQKPDQFINTDCNKPNDKY